MREVCAAFLLQKEDQKIGGIGLTVETIYFLFFVSIIFVSIIF